MSFTGRTRDAIRDALLATWAAEYAAIGERLLVAPGSDPYLWATALAVQIEALEAQAEQTARDILPDQASAAALARHGYVDDVARGVGVRARHTVGVTGPSAGPIAIPSGSRLAFSDGTLYGVDSTTVTLSGALTGSIEVTAVTLGSAGTRAAGAVLTWVVAPTGINSTGTVSSPTLRAGTDAESVESWAARIIELRQERPGSGNRSQWREWTRAYIATDIAAAYVYPLMEPPAVYPGAGTPDTPGCVTVLAIGPAQGRSFTNTRLVPTDDASTRPPGALLSRIGEYVEGTRSADGTSPGTGIQLRPVTLPAGNYSIEAINTASQAVVLSCTMDATNAFPWVGALTITASSTSTVTVSGDHTAKEGMLAQLRPGTPTDRGEYRVVTLGAAIHAAGFTTFTQATGQEVGSPTGSIYPAPLNRVTIADAVFAYFDGLGPGDTTPPSRWPAEGSETRATLYRTALAAQVIGVTEPTGVLSCAATTPGADVTPAAKAVVTLTSLLIVP